MRRCTGTSIISCGWGPTVYWGASFYSEQDATWHQSVIRDTDFTPSNIIKFYIAYPIYIITGWGAFMYARTRLPIFSKGVSLPYLIAVVGPFMNLPAAGLDAWGHTFWWMEELFVAPLHWGFAVFGWMVLGVMGVLLQIFDRMVGGELPEREKPPVEKRSGAAASKVSGGIVSESDDGHAVVIGGVRLPKRLPPEPPEPPKGFFFRPGGPGL